MSSPNAYVATIALLVTGALLYFHEPELQLGAEITPKEISDLSTLQQSSKTDAKYKQFARDEWLANTEVQEYFTSTGQAGYTLFIYEDRGRDGVFVRAISTGLEAADRSFDWQPVSPTLKNDTI